MVQNLSKNNYNNYVRVGIKLNKHDTRFYQVPEQTANDFTKEFYTQAKKTSYLESTAFFTSILMGVSLGFLTTHRIANKFIRFLVNAGTGVAAGLLSFKLTGNMADIKQLKIEKKYNAVKMD